MPAFNIDSCYFIIMVRGVWCGGGCAEECASGKGALEAHGLQISPGGRSFSLHALGSGRQFALRYTAPHASST